MDKIDITIFVFLGLIPGAMSDTLHLTGLVVSSVIAFVFLVIVIAFIVIGIVWNSWYPEMQRRKGRVKIPKERWLAMQKPKPKPYSAKYIVKDDHEDGQPVFITPSYSNVPSVRSSHFMPTPRMGFSEKADTWIQEEKPDKYEHKEGTMVFGEEAEDVIVTEVLPAEERNATQNHTTVISLTDNRPSVANNISVPAENDTPIYSVVDRQRNLADAQGKTLADEDESVAILSASKIARDNEDTVLY